MRIKNKEINARRHRKEQKIKEADRAVRAIYGDKKDAPARNSQKAPAKPAKKTGAAAKKKAEA